VKHYLLGGGGLSREICQILISNDINSQDIHTITEEDEGEFSKMVTTTDMCYISVGDPKIRKQIYLKFKNLQFPNLFEKSSNVILSDNNLGKGNIFMHNAVVTTNSSIGNFNLFNYGSSIGHDTKIGNFNTISPGSRVSGNNEIGDCVFFGANSCTVEKISIHSDVVVGAGGVVIRDLKEKGTYVGVPCKLINKKETKNV